MAESLFVFKNIEMIGASRLCYKNLYSVGRKKWTLCLIYLLDGPSFMFYEKENQKSNTIFLQISGEHNLKIPHSSLAKWSSYFKLQTRK